MKHDFTGKIALITGASRGIGAAVAKGLAGAGAHVILMARTVGGLEAVDDEIRATGGSATLLPMDVTSLEHTEKLGPAVYEKFGKLDIFIGNAAILGPLTPTHQVKPKDWGSAMLANFMANTRLVRTLDPLLRASDAGRIVFTTSALGEKPLAYWGPYCASKAALNMFAKVYAAETEKTNLRINLISPGVVDTAMVREAFPGGYQGELKKPEDVVPAYLDLCSPKCKKHGEIISL
jgi:NAD(P)-dependent dehydrogenase (short-subunit alcohol dehydrogenase family)